MGNRGLVSEGESISYSYLATGAGLDPVKLVKKVKKKLKTAAIFIFTYFLSYMSQIGPINFSVLKPALMYGAELVGVFSSSKLSKSQQKSVSDMYVS